MKHTKATTQAQASRAYRLGKINAEKFIGEPMTVYDVDEYRGELYWTTADESTEVYTDTKGKIVGWTI